jgi:hypothetical protein
MIKVIVNDYELELFEDTVVALSKKSATIGNLQNRYSSFTNKFNIPATRANRSALGITQFQDNSGVPYDTLNGKIISGGIEIATNVSVIIESVSDSISLSIRAGNGSIFDKFNSTFLYDIDTSDIDQYWNGTAILNSLTNDWTDGIIFPITQTGNQSLLFNRIQSKGVIPFVFCKSLFERIATLFGYTWTGDTYTNDQFEKLLIAISSLNISQRFAQTLGCRMELVPFSYINALSVLYPNFTIQYDPWNLIFDSGNTDPTLGATKAYFVPLPGSYTVEFDYDVTVTSKVLAQSRIMEVVVDLRNAAGVSIINKAIVDISPAVINVATNYTGTAIVNFSFDEIFDNIPVWENNTQAANNFGATAFVQMIFDLSGSNVDVSFNSGEFRVQEIAVQQTHFHRPLSIADHLPEWTIGQFVKEVGNIFGAIYNVDEYTKEIEITRLDEISTNKNEALDWSEKLDLSQEITVTFTASGIGQTTTLQWNEFLLYAYNLSVANDQLPDNTTYIKSEADYSISAILGLQTIPVMSFDVWDIDNGRIDMDNNARFGMLGSNPGTIIIGNPLTGSRTPFPFAYFDYTGSQHSLDWGVLFSRYFDSLLVPMTDKIQRVTCFIRLNDVDIQKFKFKYPIFIQHFNRYFYVDEISEYTGKNQSTKIVLMGI